VLPSLLGPGMAVLLYAVLERRGVVRWLAAVAAAPVLLDAYQRQMEQMVTPDVWFEAMIVGGLVLLLWRPVVSAPSAAWVGLIFGTSATFKILGVVLIVPGVVYLLAVGGARRRAASGTVAFAAAFALPIVVYGTIHGLSAGHFRLAAGPGPLLALCALLGLAGPVLALAGRTRGTRSRQFALACVLLTFTTVVVLLAPDVLEFSWRSQLPVLITLPPAGALAIAALRSEWRTRRGAAAERFIEASDVAWVPAPSRATLPS
jgi:hypothetical protein